MPLKNVNLLINTNYSFPTDKSASQTQPQRLYYSQPECSGPEQRESTEMLQICQTKEEIIGEGLNMGVIT